MLRRRGRGHKLRPPELERPSALDREARTVMDDILAEDLAEMYALLKRAVSEGLLDINEARLRLAIVTEDPDITREPDSVVRRSFP